MKSLNVYLLACTLAMGSATLLAPQTAHAGFFSKLLTKLHLKKDSKSKAADQKAKHYLSLNPGTKSWGQVQSKTKAIKKLMKDKNLSSGMKSKLKGLLTKYDQRTTQLDDMYKAKQAAAEEAAAAEAEAAAAAAATPTAVATTTVSEVPVTDLTTPSYVYDTSSTASSTSASGTTTVAPEMPSLPPSATSEYTM